MAETTAASEVALPDDAVREILARVADAATIFRCATTWKRWRVLVADPFFLRRRWPKDSPGSSSLFGFFIDTRWRGREPVFVPAPRAPLGSIGSCFLLELFFPNAAGLLHGAEPLTSRRGLILLRLRHGVPLGAIHLAVCNPLTGTCDVLPPLECDTFFPNACYAILTAADCCSKGEMQISPSQGYSTFFKVLIIGSRLEDIHMFSSEGSSWTVFREWFTDRGSIFSPEVRSAVVCGGTAYWLLSSRSGYYTLQVSTDAGHVSEAKLSIQRVIYDTDTTRLGIAADGKLSLLCLRRSGDQVEEWTRQDGDGSTAEWICTRVIEVQRSIQKRHGRRRGPAVRSGRAQVICASERSNMLLFKDPRIHIADLKTGRTEYVTGQFNGLDLTVCVPFEVDWAAFFSSRLGGRNLAL